MPDLLIELLSEEIPAKMQGKASENLKKLMTDGLVEAGLTYAQAYTFATPRRLTLAVEGLLAASPATHEERKGPRVDAPEKAVEGFLRSTGLTREQLETRDDKKGEVFYAVIKREGQPAAKIVAEVLETTVRSFPWPKSMRWGAGSLRWVRPLQGILCLLSDETGAEVVTLDIDGIKAGDSTVGHRFHAPNRFSVGSFEDYAAQLKRAFVVLDPAERAEAIWHDATTAAFAMGLEVVEDRALLTEVAGLVEWPVVLIGEIAEAFRGLPAEVLQTSMREHQKFFSLRNSQGKITHFATVANRETADNGATILNGNQRVLSARLSDGKFFWENDLRTAKDGMAAWKEALTTVTFHAKLGSESDRIARLGKLAEVLAPQAGADPAQALQAAATAKLDLASEMVYEFPELQGVMGRYYAEVAGLTPEVAAAAEAHYKPLGPSDDVPDAPVSIAVALADKLDVLTGFWAIDEKPTGSRDPFALRRAALGVIRLVLANDLRLPLEAALTAAQQGHAAPDADKAADLLGFLHDRLKVYLKDEGLRYDVIDACLAMAGADDLALVVARARALQSFLATEDGGNLVQGFKRANNILAQAEAADGVSYSYGADKSFAEATEEEALFDALEAAEPVLNAALAQENFAAAMTAMAGLRAPVDAFFDAVQVNSENSIIRRNRLNLLSSIRSVCGAVADLTVLEG